MNRTVESLVRVLPSYYNSLVLLTLTTVVKDVGVFFVLLQGLLKALEGFGDITALHVDTRQLHPGLCVAWQEGDRRF